MSMVLRRCLKAVAVIGLLGMLYFGWAFERTNGQTLVEDMGHWPRSFPYPDRWISDLDQHYDHLYPAPPGTIKLDGEFRRVRITILAMAAVCVGLLLVGGIPLLVGWYSGRMVKRGFPVIELKDGEAKNDAP